MLNSTQINNCNIILDLLGDLKEDLSKTADYDHDIVDDFEELIEWIVQTNNNFEEEE